MSDDLVNCYTEKHLNQWLYTNFLLDYILNFNPFASKAVYKHNFFSDRMSDSV